MKKEKPPQAPKGKWRYGVVKRKYKTITPKMTSTQTSYELVEVYDQGRSWTSEAVCLAAASKKGLTTSLQFALQDLDSYDVIVDNKVIIRRIGFGKKKKIDK